MSQAEWLWPEISEQQYKQERDRRLRLDDIRRANQTHEKFIFRLMTASLREYAFDMAVEILSLGQVAARDVEVIPIRLAILDADGAPVDNEPLFGAVDKTGLFWQPMNEESGYFPRPALEGPNLSDDLLERVKVFKAGRVKVPAGALRT